MEVKIKIGDEIIDAKIVMMNGDMVVSPKVEKFEPKDGDVVYVKTDLENIIIYKEQSNKLGRYVNYMDEEDLYFNTGDFCGSYAEIIEIRPATEEEKQKLFDRLKEEGYEWDAEKKELVKLKWKPKAGQSYYIPIICNAKFKAIIEDWSDDSMDALYLDKGWCFKTKEECQAFCDKLNKAIEGVKP